MINTPRKVGQLIALTIVLQCLGYWNVQPSYAQMNIDTQAYQARLIEAAQILEAAKETACCQADGTLDSQVLEQGYQDAYFIAVEEAIASTDSEGESNLWPLLDPAIINALENGTNVPELTDEVDAALARLQVTIGQIEAMADDQTEARLDVLENVLARPEFQTQLTFWQRFTRWLAQLWERFFPETQGNGTSVGWMGPLVGWTLGILAAVALIVLLSYWIQRLVGSFISNAEIEHDSGLDGDPISAQQARKQAAQQAEAGNYRGAVRRLYLAALLTMEEKGAIRHDRSQTNREVLAQVKYDEGVASHLRPIVETFDDVWYGVHEPDHQTYTDYTQEVDQLTAAANQHRAESEKGTNAGEKVRS